MFCPCSLTFIEILRCSAAGASKRHISAFGNGFRATREAPANHRSFLLSVADLFFFFFFSFAFFYSSERLSPCIRLGVGDFDNANAGDCLLGDDLCNTGDSLIMM